MSSPDFGDVIEVLEDRALLSSDPLVEIVAEQQSGVTQTIVSSFQAVSGLGTSFTVNDTNEIYRFSGSLAVVNQSTNPTLHAIDIAFFVDGSQAYTQTFEVAARNPANGDESQHNFSFEDFMQFGTTGSHSVDVRVLNVAAEPGALVVDGSFNDHTLKVVRFQSIAGSPALAIVAEQQSGVTQTIVSSFQAVGGLGTSFTVNDTNEIYRFSGSLAVVNQSTNPTLHAIDIAFFVDGSQAYTQTFEVAARNPANGDESQHNFSFEDFMQFGTTGSHSVDVRVLNVAAEPGALVVDGSLNDNTLKVVKLVPIDANEVNLSVSASSGTEVAQTQITVTATVTSPVNGDQTVTLVVSGTGITAGDFTLTDGDTGTAGIQIKILNGQTTGTVTFTINDDLQVEGTETATLTISNPTAGISLGTTLSQNIAITDNDTASAATYGTPDDGVADSVRVVLNGANIEIYSVPGNVLLESRSFASLTDGLTIQGAAGENDTLTVDFSGGNSLPTGGLTFNGGTGGNDSLIISGGTTTSVTHTFTNANDGSVMLAGALTGTITYNGLEPITDNLSATNRVFTFNGGAETITLTDAAGENMTIDSTLSESVTFANPTGSLTINAGSGDDIVTISSVDANGPFNAALTINGDPGSDTVNQNASLSLGTASVTGHVAITAEIVNINGSINTTPGATDGAVTLTADQQSLAAAITTGTAAVTLTPTTSGRAIVLGGVDSGTQLGLTDTELDLVSANKLIIGSGTAGVITNSESIDLTDSPSIPMLQLDSANTVTLSTGTVKLNALTSNAPLSITAGLLSILENSTINASLNVSGTGTLTLDTLTLGGTGSLTNAATVSLTGANLNTPLDNLGLLLVRAGSSTLSGTAPLTTSATSIVRVFGEGGMGIPTLTVADGFTNEGLIELVANGSGNFPTLIVTSGTLLNASGATILSETGGAAGGRTINAQVDNQGAITVNLSLDVTNAGRTFASSLGTLNVAGGTTLSINGGTTQLVTASLLPGSGTINLAGTHTLNLPSDLILSSSNPTLTFGGTVTVNGPGTLINQTTLELHNDTINTPLNNQSLLLVRAGSSTLTAAAPLTTSATSTLRVFGEGGMGIPTLTVANGFTNQGLIELVANGSGNFPTLIVTSGTLVNADGGTILSETGGAAGARNLNAQVDNQGIITVNFPLMLNKVSADHLNSGTINATGGDLTVTQSGSTPTFTNSGTFNISAGRTLNLSGGSFANFSGGTLTDGTYNILGTFKFDGAAITTNAATVVLNGAASTIVNQLNANALADFHTNTAAGIFTIQNGRNFTTAGALSNSGAMTVGTSSTLSTAGTNNYTQTAGTTTVNGGLTSSGIIAIQGGMLNGSGTVTGTTTISNGSTVNPGTSPGILNVVGPFTENGALNIEIGGTTAGNTASDHDQVNVTGMVTLGAASTLATTAFNGFVPVAGNTFAILVNDGTDAITGTFNLLAEGATLSNFLGTGLDAKISYVANTDSGTVGNDVVLTFGELETSVTLDGSNNLVITDTNSGTSNDTLTIQSNTTTSQFIITAESGTISTTIAGATGNGTSTVSVPFASVSGTQILVNTLAGNDSLTIDLSLGNFSKTITYDGGNPTVATGDSLILTGGTFATVTHTFTSNSAGTIDVTGNTQFSYLGLEPVTDNLSATNRVFTFNGGTETITLTDATDPTGMTIDSTLGESVTFAYPSGFVTINPGTGADTVALTSVDAAYSGTVTVNTTADDNFSVGAGSTFTGLVGSGGKVFSVYTQGAAQLRVSGLVDLSASSNGTTGFRLDGIDANDQSGLSVSSAGDVNGDGFDDLLIGAFFADPNGDNDAGESYVVFGKSSGFTAAFDLNTLDGTTGFRLDGIDPFDNAGGSVSSAGDVNGDGFDDLLIGAHGGDPNGDSAAGESYVVFGKSTGFAATLDLNTLNGTTGFRLIGIDAGDYSGRSVSSAGDVNGDGFDDLLIGAFRGNPNGDNLAGESYVVFGKSSGFAATVDLSTLDGTTGFRLDGIDAVDFSGRSVSSAGDVNGDGFDDLFIGAHYGDPNGDSSAGESYVVFGKSSGFTATLDLSTLNGTNGFRLDGIDADDFSGRSVSSAGDVNGDGFDDLLIGAYGGDPNGLSYAGESYVVFGKSTGFGAVLDLSTLNGTTGFRVDGINAYDRSGRSVSSAGDVNGDGFDDLLIGAHGGDPNGDNDAGESYIVFGKSSGFSATLDLATLNGATGFRLDGIDASDFSGVSVSSAGDVNGDGFDDLLVGAHGGDPNGDSDAGESYVVFGGNFTGGVETQVGSSAANTLTANQGAAAIDVLIGQQGTDTLISDGGADVLLGGEGNDTLQISDSTFQRIVGGSGSDTLQLNGSGLTLNLSTLADNKLTDIEVINLTGSGNNTLTLSQLEVLNLSSTSNTLLVRRNAGDTVNMGSGWTQGSNETIGLDMFEVFTQGAATLKVQSVAPATATLSIRDVMVAEGHSGTTTFTFNVTLSAATENSFSVGFQTMDGTATTANLDYVPINSNSGMVIGAFDSTRGGAYGLFDGSGAAAMRAQIQANFPGATILETNTLTSAFLSSVNVVWLNSVTDNFTATSPLSAAEQSALQNFVSAGGGAILFGENEVFNDSTLLAPFGLTTTGLTFDITSGTITNAMHPVTDGPFGDVATLSSNYPGNITTLGGATSLGTWNSTGQSALAALTFGSGKVVALTDVNLYVDRLSAADNTKLLLNSLAFVRPPTVLQFAGTAGEVHKIQVFVNGDIAVEPTELFSVVLGSVIGTGDVVISDGTGIGTIINDDFVPVVNDQSFSINENSANNSVVGTVAATDPGDVLTYSILSGNTGGAFQINSSTGQLTVLNSMALDFETTPTFLMTVKAQDAGGLSDTAVVTINLNNLQATLSINDRGQAEGNSGTSQMTFTVTLSSAIGTSFRVPFRTADGTAPTATANTDYVPLNSSSSLVIGAFNAARGGTFGLGNTASGAGSEAMRAEILANFPGATIVGVGAGGLTSAFLSTVNVVWLNSVSSNTTSTPPLSAAEQLALQNFVGSGGGAILFGETDAFDDSTLLAPFGLETTGSSVGFISGIITNPAHPLTNGPFGTVTTISSNYPGNLTGLGSATSLGTWNSSGLSALATLNYGAGKVVALTDVNFYADRLNQPGNQNRQLLLNALAFAQPPSSLQFAGTAGELHTLQVTINGDGQVEPDENLSVLLTSIIGSNDVTILDGSGMGTIVNDDAPAILQISDALISERTGRSASALFNVTLSSPSKQSVTVNFSTANISSGVAAVGTGQMATVGKDFQAQTGTLRFAPGQLSQTISIPILDDLLHESDEAFFLQLSSPTGARISDGIGQATIRDNDAAPKLTINDVTVTEKTNATVNAAFTVTLSAASAVPVTVNFATAVGTAATGADYQSARGTITFNPGETTKTITVVTNDDLLYEASEMFYVNLTNAMQAAILDGQGLGTIKDNDRAPSLAISDVRVIEGGTAIFTVSLSGPSGVPVIVSYATANGTANAGREYAATSGTLTFAAGETTKTIRVAIAPNAIAKASKSFNVNLSRAVNAVFADSQALATIFDSGN